MKKNGAFVNLFLSGGMQKSPKWTAGNGKKRRTELLFFK